MKKVVKHSSGLAHIFLILLVVGIVIVAIAYTKGIFAGPKHLVGSLDSVDNKNCTIRGWAYDPAKLTKAAKIHVYRDGPAGGAGTKVYEGEANTQRGDISKDYKGDHGFVVTFDDKSEIKNGKEHHIYVYAIASVKNGKNVLLSGSPRTINCESSSDPCALTSDKFKFTVNLTTVDGRTIEKLDGVKVAVDLTDNARVGILKNNQCLPKDLPKTLESKGGKIEFSGLPIRNYNVRLNVGSLPMGYRLADGQSEIQLLSPAADSATGRIAPPEVSLSINFKLARTIVIEATSSSTSVPIR